MSTIKVRTGTKEYTVKKLNNDVYEIVEGKWKGNTLAANDCTVITPASPIPERVELPKVENRPIPDRIEKGCEYECVSKVPLPWEKYFEVGNVYESGDDNKIKGVRIKGSYNLLPHFRKIESATEQNVKGCEGYTFADLVELVQSLKDYTAESRNILGHDEREAVEFVDEFLHSRKSIPFTLSNGTTINLTKSDIDKIKKI